MSDSNTFRGTITNGIQDISALLPLLGTEQCEKHVGSALDRGFLYSSVTPVSIFGSLGIVRAAFNILIVSLSNTRFRFLGARLLKNGGFNPSGTISPMIALDPKHPLRFLAETRLEEMLSNEHIKNVDNLTVSWGKDAIRWNITLVLSTLLISSVGLLPYLSIILEPGNTNLPLHGFGFPILRVFGSAICVTVPQVVIQIRILTLLKTRLLMMSVDRLVKEVADEDMASTINAKNGWSSELAAEKCLWTLNQWLASRQDHERGIRYTEIKRLYETAVGQQLGPEYVRIRRWTNPLLFLLAAACVSTVVGYIGCFFVVQRSQTSRGPLLWLVLEAVLSVFRIFIWAVNPSFDDSEGMIFELHLSNHPPMITCNRFVSEILDDKIRAPVQRHDTFLEEIVAYTGPLPVFSVQDVELYYMIAPNATAVDATAMDWTDLAANLLTGAIFTNYERIENATNSRCLLIVIYAYKEQTSRVLFKETVNGPFSIYDCSLHSTPNSSVYSVRVVGTTNAKTHFLTSNPVFMNDLGAHYDNILSNLTRRPTNVQIPSRKAPYRQTWAMQLSLAQTGEGNNDPPLEQAENMPLTEGEMAYINRGVAEQRRHDASQRIEQWINDNVGTYANTLKVTPWFTLNQASGNEDEVSHLRQFEAIEKEYLVCEYQTLFELFLMSLTMKWDNDIQMYHNNMVTHALGPLTLNASLPSDKVRFLRLKRWLNDELSTFLVEENINRRNSIQNRVTASRTTVFTADGFDDPLTAGIRQRWDTLLQLMPRTPDAPAEHTHRDLMNHQAFRFHLAGDNPQQDNRARQQTLEQEINNRFLHFPDVPATLQIDRNVRANMQSRAIGSLQALYDLSSFGPDTLRGRLTGLNITHAWFIGVEVEQLIDSHNQWKQTMPLVPNQVASRAVAINARRYIRIYHWLSQYWAQ